MHHTRRSELLRFNLSRPATLDPVGSGEKRSGTCAGLVYRNALTISQKFALRADADLGIKVDTNNPRGSVGPLAHYDVWLIRRRVHVSYYMTVDVI